MTGKLVLVTGGAGGIGSNLIKQLLVQGNRVIALDNYFAGLREAEVPGAEYRTGHTKDIEAIVPETPDLIYHFGEYSRPEPSFDEVDLVLDLNIIGTIGVVEYWRKRKCKLLYAGSSTKFADDGLGRDQSPYSWTKAVNTELVRNYGAWFGLPFAITYFYNTYGPGDRVGKYGTVIEVFRRQFLKGEPLTVTSPGTQRRNFTHVDDIVEGLILIGEQGEGDGYALGNEKDYSILEIAQMYGGKIQMMPEKKGNRMKGFIDTAKSKALGWSAKRGIEEYISSVKTIA